MMLLSFRNLGCPFVSLSHLAQAH